MSQAIINLKSMTFVNFRLKCMDNICFHKVSLKTTKPASTLTNMLYTSQ